MDIFTSEEVEDEDISVLMDGLSQFDSEILLGLSSDILVPPEGSPLVQVAESRRIERSGAGLRERAI